MKKAFFYETQIGNIGIAENGRAITNVFFGNTVVPKEYKVEETLLLKEAAKQLLEYLNGIRKVLVIGSNGKLTGYAGGLTMKHQLLELETNKKYE